MELYLAIKPCPWCKHTGKLHLHLDKETWVPFIECNNSFCNVQPKSKYVSIRKTSKKDLNRFLCKIDKLLSYWNNYNPTQFKELTGIDLSILFNKIQFENLINSFLFIKKNKDELV